MKKRWNYRMEKESNSLKELRLDPHVLAGIRQFQRRRRRKNMRPRGMRCSATGALNAWPLQVMQSSTARWITLRRL